MRRPGILARPILGSTDRDPRRDLEPASIAQRYDGIAPQAGDFGREGSLDQKRRDFLQWWCAELKPNGDDVTVLFGDTVYRPAAPLVLWMLRNSRVHRSLVRRGIEQ